MSVHEAFDSPESVRRWNPEISEWRAAADEGRLLLKACGDCGRAHYYPRALCPFCFSDNTSWQESVGRGFIYSFAVERRGAEPLVIAYVTLDEGPTIMTNIVNAQDLRDVQIGSRVDLDPETSRGRRAPFFRIARDPA